MTDKRQGTSLCGWCLGPPGARRPHRFGIPTGKCPCGCHRKPRKIETVETIVDQMEGGKDDAA
jgi:hypothetical protein